MTFKVNGVADPAKVLGVADPVKVLGVPSPIPFVFTITTSASPQDFTPPLGSGGTYDFDVDWGDGNSDTITTWNQAEATHSYATAGTYEISITRVIIGFRFANGGDKTMIREIKEWGPLRLGNGNGYFYGCSNLTVTATDNLDLTGTTNFENAFRATTSLTTMPSANTWDTAAISSTKYCFYQSTFNDAIGAWDMGANTDMQYMFAWAAQFNQAIGTWDVSANLYFQGMFENSGFNQPLATWDVSSGLQFNIMFRSTSFNQPIPDWNTVSGTTFEQMFRSSSFDQDVGDWPVTALTNATRMFYEISISTANWSSLLVGWEAQAVLNNVTVDGGGSTYSAGAPATARADLIADHSWTIVDGGAA